MKKKIMFIGIAVVLMCIIAIILVNNTNRHVYNIEENIENVSAGYTYAKKMVNTLDNETTLVSYSVAYFVNNIGGDSTPYYYEYTFKINETEEEENAYIVNIDLDDKVLTIVRGSVLSTAVETPFPIETPKLETVIFALKENNEDIFNQVLEKNMDAVIIITKAYSYKNISSTNWEIIFTSKDYILGEWKETYKEFNYDNNIKSGHYCRIVSLFGRL